MRLRALCGGLSAAALLMTFPAVAGAHAGNLRNRGSEASSLGDAGAQASGLRAARAQTAGPQKYHVQLLHWNVKVGPGHKTTCNVIGQLYRPDSATKQHPAPAILTTNGFGGSYASQAPLAKEFAQDGYVVLAYSGLGFGGSSCRITLDSTVWDGAAASALVNFLGGGSAATNGTRVNYVKTQKRADNGKRYKHDPVVGMVGGSYGGAVQFAAAADDPRIDAIIPVITWNNLAYSLAPNNATISPTSVSYLTPGVTKATWLGLFWLLGQSEQQVAPHGGASSCPNFSAPECPADANLSTDGYPDSATLNLVKSDSVADFMHKIRIPTMLMQGEDDTLFTLHEAVATYHALRQQHTPVKMVWQSWGHSDPVAQPGELGEGGGIYQTYKDRKLTLEGSMILDWFNYYLRHVGPKPALNFSYYRPWVHYKGTDAAASYASASSYPVGKTTNMYLSGTDALTPSASTITPGSFQFTTPALGAPESVSDDPQAALGGSLPPISDPAGTFADYESAPLKAPLNVVGIPKLTVTVKGLDAPAGSGPITNTIGLYFKIEDIKANGTAVLPDRLIAAARFVNNDKPTSVYLPGIVHQFPKGDRLKLIIAGSDQSYFLADPDVTIQVSTGSAKSGVLSLPVVSKSAPVKLTQR